MGALAAFRSGLLDRRAAASEASRTRIDIVIATGVFVVIYVAAYALVISPAFHQTGLVNRLAPDGSILLALAAAILPALWLPASAVRASDVALWVIYLAGFVPTLLVPAFILGSGWALTPLWLVVGSGFTLVVMLAGSVPLRLPHLPMSELGYARILGLLAVVFAGAVIAWFGFPTQIPNLFDVASARDEYREELAGVGGFAGYAVYWAGQVFGPLLVACGIWMRRRSMVLGGLGVFLLVYATTAFRSLLFAIALLVGLIIVVRRWRRPFGIVMPTIASLMIVASTIVAWLGWSTPISLVVRRLLVVPGQVMAYNYDFFSEGPVYRLSHSILRGIIAQPYPEAPPALIGRLYFHDPRAYANGNMWADAMANFGLPGMLAASLLLAVILMAMNALTSGRPASVVLPIAGVGVWRLTNSALLTTVASHGLAVLLVLLWLLPRGRRPEPAKVPLRVAHLTSVHRSNDPRIFLKECSTLARAGYEVTLVGRGAGPADAETAGVRFVSVGDTASRRERMLRLPLRILREAWRLRADVYHVHDPELLPAGLVLKALGRRVIYDVHEDVPRQIAYKTYMPAWLRRVSAVLAGGLESVIGLTFDGIVAATPHIASRFPSAKTAVVRNYPLLDEFAGAAPSPLREREDVVTYVGRVTEEIGALVMADVAKIIGSARPVRFVVAGPVSQVLSERVAGRASPVQVEQPGWLDRDAVMKLLDETRIGLVLFQPYENYLRAYPTKLFEYMAAGVPVVASDFPDWREFVDGTGCGVLVDPQDPQAVAAAIRELLDDSERAAAMGASGRRAVAARYNWAAEGDELLRLYRRVLEVTAPIPDVVGSTATVW